MERSIRYNFFDLESIQHKFSSDYSLSTCFSNPYKMSIFESSVTCSFFSGIVLTYLQELREKFEDMFLVKIANKVPLHAPIM